MARAPRLVLPGHAHLVLLRGHDGTAVARDDTDVRALVETLRLLSQRSDIELYAWRVHPGALYLLLRPLHAQAVSRAVQWLGRRYVAAFNKRHGRSGTLWDGRYRSAVLQPGEPTLHALRFMDQPAGDVVCDSSASRLGGISLAWLRQPPEYWSLGNTPFDRERLWRDLIGEPVPAAALDALHAALRSGRVFGDPVFVADVSRQVGRDVVLRRPGRPSRTPS